MPRITRLRDLGSPYKRERRRWKSGIEDSVYTCGEGNCHSSLLSVKDTEVRSTDAGLSRIGRF